MGLLDKLKNMFTEEEIEENEPIKKEELSILKNMKKPSSLKRKQKEVSQIKR